MKFYTLLTILLITFSHQVSSASAYRRTMSAPIRLQQNNNRLPLHEAVRKHECDDFAELLKKNYNPNKQDKFGMTAMHIAAERNCPNMIRKLLEHKANPNIANAPILGQRTPLHLAILNYNVPVVITLAQHPATDLTIQDITEQTALQLAKKYFHNRCSKKHYKDLIQLLTPKK